MPAARPRETVAGLRLINYYPSDHAWELMWTRWDAAGFRSDMSRAASLGANTVRLIVFPNVFGYPTPRPRMLDELELAIRLARDAGLSVQLTLFDHWHDYGDLSGSVQWTTKMLSPLRAFPSVIVVELQNEVSPEQPAVLRWLRAQVPLVKSILPRALVTASVVGSSDNASLQTLRSALTGPASLSLFDVHVYGSLLRAAGILISARSVVGGAPLLIGETGQSAVPGSRALTARRQDEQATWYAYVFSIARDLGLPPPAPWSLFDFTPSAIPYSTTRDQYHVGLIDLSGKLKPAGQVVRAFFSCPGTRLPAPGGFGTGVGDPPLPEGWRAWFPSGRYSMVAHAGISGAMAVRLTGTSTQRGGITSLYTTVNDLIRSGQRWRATVWARGNGATGTSRLEISWFDAEGRWLGASPSAPLPAGTSVWRQLSVDTAPPAHAVSAQVHLQVEGNRGSTVFSQPSWSLLTR